MPPIEASEHHHHHHQQQQQQQLGQLRRPPKPGHVAGGAPVAAEQEHLACPRCDSTNTKFCYYNNYNFSQPRHFCKSCRRYWTHGGTLRDIPVGGGTRKTAKRSRLSSPPSGSPSPFPSPSLLLSADKMGPPPPAPPPSFTSLLSAGPPGGPGFLALGGLGLGLEDLGFGIGRGVWGFHGGDAVIGGVGGARGIGATWQLENGGGGGGQFHHHHHHLHGGLVATAAAAGDYCSWAEPAVISTPTATAFK